MNDYDGTVVKINILNLDRQGFSNPAAQVKEKMNEDFIPEVAGSLLQEDYFCRFKIGFH
jgi:hypothetical protein